MPKTTYSDDFRRHAVLRVTQDGHSRRQVCRDLGVSAGALRGWIHAYAPEGARVSEELPEAEQLRQLRRENVRLRQERDILKKAVGIFSQVPQQK